MVGRTLILVILIAYVPIAGLVLAEVRGLFIPAARAVASTRIASPSSPGLPFPEPRRTVTGHRTQVGGRWEDRPV